MTALEAASRPPPTHLGGGESERNRRASPLGARVPGANATTSSFCPRFARARPGRASSAAPRIACVSWVLPDETPGKLRAERSARRALVDAAARRRASRKRSCPRIHPDICDQHLNTECRGAFVCARKHGRGAARRQRAPPTRWSSQSLRAGGDRGRNGLSATAANTLNASALRRGCSRSSSVGARGWELSSSGPDHPPVAG